MLKYAFLALGAFLIAALVGWLPAAWLQPFREAELRLLYLASTEGPSGSDDGVQMQIINHPNRYSGPLVRMLEAGPPASKREVVALYFIELVRGPADVDTFLKDFAEGHPDPNVRDFIQDVLNSPTPQQIIAARQR